MAGITIAHAQGKLEEYLAAESKILMGQTVAIDGQTLTRANLLDVQRGVTLWNNRIQEITLKSSGRSRMRTVSVIG